jgi:hypothetical protein
MSNARTHRFGVVSLVLALPAAAACAQSLELLASLPLADLDVITNTTQTRELTFSGVDELVTGVGISGLYTGVRRDNEDGLGPWSLDVRLVSQAPSGQSVSWNPIGGDRTIADYPFQDGTGGFPGVEGNGTWSFAFSSTQPLSIWTYGLRDVQMHLLGDAPTQIYTYTAAPDPAISWSRPFFIAGTSGLGPVSYDLFEFTVTRSGVYEFTSLLSTGGDHFSCLYAGGFDPQQPLVNLLDYGLGNGNSPFNVPRGTSSFEALLIEGEQYAWVTTQWSRFTAIAPSANTISGPGLPVEPGVPCTGDIADDFGTLGSDGQVSFGDFLALLGLVGPCPGGTPGCVGDIADDFGTLGSDGQVSFGDFLALLGLVGGCP